MILLDTNVLSAIVKPIPEVVVAAWLDRQSRHGIWTSTISIFAIEYGLSLMPDGRRRTHLESAFARLLEEEFRGKIANFDSRAAIEAGKLMAQRKREGRDDRPHDAMIALSRGAPLQRET